MSIFGVTGELTTGEYTALVWEDRTPYSTTQERLALNNDNEIFRGVYPKLVIASSINPEDAGDFGLTHLWATILVEGDIITVDGIVSWWEDSFEAFFQQAANVLEFETSSSLGYFRIKTASDVPFVGNYKWVLLY